MEPKFSLHHLLSSLQWFLGVAEVVIVAAILEDEGVDLLEEVVVLIEADRVL